MLLFGNERVSARMRVCVWEWERVRQRAKSSIYIWHWKFDQADVKVRNPIQDSHLGVRGPSIKTINNSLPECELVSCWIRSRANHSSGTPIRNTNSWVIAWDTGTIKMLFVCESDVVVFNRNEIFKRIFSFSYFHWGVRSLKQYTIQAQYFWKNESKSQGRNI